ncbi:hypothetical protein CRE_16527 [Caenorhabditis remanei]|uniref:Uncharacterized protein n=1 Tax=Caenorhabditis remanei TaxID=31234 RepID=E3NP46_CAERE|nr:hypothetical protein CRE_16527 [Caenorhabditis remanei]
MMKAILFVSSLTCVNAAFPPCEAGRKCPPSGIWGEWATEGNGVCKLECGSCAELFQTRTCLSSEIPECICTGISSRFIPCNMQTCQYPIQKSCCIPYVPMVINGTMICGPVPKTMKEPAVSCCPVGGLWSEYSTGYQRINNRWVRTRRCISESVGCPCIGDPTTGSSNCPCVQPPSAASACPSIPNGRPGTMKNLAIQHESCTATLEMVNHNNFPGSPFCSSLRELNVVYPYVALLIMDEVDGGCTYDYVSECINVNKRQSTEASFTCNTETRNWIYDYTGKEIRSYVQGAYITVYH